MGVRVISTEINQLVRKCCLVYFWGLCCVLQTILEKGKGPAHLDLFSWLVSLRVLERKVVWVRNNLIICFFNFNLLVLRKLNQVFVSSLLKFQNFAFRVLLTNDVTVDILITFSFTYWSVVFNGLNFLFDGWFFINYVFLTQN